MVNFFASLGLKQKLVSIFGAQYLLFAIFFMYTNYTLIKEPLKEQFTDSVNTMSSLAVDAASYGFSHGNLNGLDEQIKQLSDNFETLWFSLYIYDAPLQNIDNANEIEPFVSIAKNIDSEFMDNINWLDKKNSFRERDWIYLNRLIFIDGIVVGNFEVALPLSTIANFLNPAIRSSIILSLILTAIGSILVFLVSWWLIHRLRSLEQASVAISKGDYNVYIDEKSKDELAKTAQAFNHMINVLNDNISKLGAAKEQFRIVFESSQNGFVLIDTEGKIFMINNAAVGIFGFENKDDLIDKYLYDFHLKKYHTKERMSKSEIIKASSYNTNNTYSINVYEDKEIILRIYSARINIGGKSYLSLSILDVTKEYEKEQSLRLSESRMRSIIEVSRDAIILLNERGIIQEFSPAAQELFLCQWYTVYEKSIFDLFLDEENKDTFRKMINNVMNSFRNSASNNLINTRERIILKNYEKESFAAEVTLSPHIDSFEKNMIVAFIRDISEQEKAKQEIINARQQAEQASLTKSRFLALMSHEVRTPLTGIIGVLELFDEEEISPKQRRLLKLLHNSSQHLLTLLNDILDWTRIESGKLSIYKHAFNVNEMISAVIYLMKPLATQKDLALNVHYLCDKDSIPIVRGDDVRIKQILINLLSNAIKFTEEGSITMKIDCKINNGYGNLKFNIIDTGPGISKEEQKLLFKEFSQLTYASQNKKGGVGLGLSISRRLVKLMGGVMVLHSTLGKGSDFYISIPFDVVNEDNEILDTFNSYDYVDDKQFNILLVEDNLTNQFITKSILENSNYKVDVVANGLEALVATDKKQYRVILMDISMPVMGGIEATNKIRTNTNSPNQKTPIVGFSAHAYTADKEQAIEAGMNEFLTKPIVKNHLLKTIAKFWHQNNSTEIKVVESNVNMTNIENKDIINESVLLSLEEEIGKDIAKTIYGSFYNDNVKYFENIKEYQKTWDIDLELLNRSAHSIKGAAASLGLDSLKEEAKILEDGFRNQQIDVIDENIEKFNNVWQETIEAIKLKFP